MASRHFVVECATVLIRCRWPGKGLGMMRGEMKVMVKCRGEEAGNMQLTLSRRWTNHDNYRDRGALLREKDSAWLHSVHCDSDTRHHSQESRLLVSLPR